MQKSLFVQCTLVASLMGVIAPTTLAAPLLSQPEVAPTTQTLSSDTGLVVQFPIALSLAIDEGQPYPISLPLAQAIVDAQGNVIVPAQTPVGMRLQPLNGGVQLVAESLVINGRLIPIAALGPVIPGTTTTHGNANAAATQSSAVFSNLFANTAGLLSHGNPGLSSQAGMLGSVVGTLAGLQSPQTSRLVQIPKDATYVLSLSAPVTF